MAQLLAVNSSIGRTLSSSATRAAVSQQSYGPFQGQSANQPSPARQQRATYPEERVLRLVIILFECPREPSDLCDRAQTQLARFRLPGRREVVKLRLDGERNHRGDFDTAHIQPVVALSNSTGEDRLAVRDARCSRIE